MRLGEMLLERQFVTAEDLERALELQKERGEKIGKILGRRAATAPRATCWPCLSDSCAFRWSAIDGPPPVSPETEKLSPRFLRQFRCLPVALQDSSADARDGGSARFRNALGRADLHRPASRARARIRAGDPRRRRQILRRARPHVDCRISSGDGQAAEDLEHLRDMASEAPVIRLVNAMIAQAVEKRASDIHIEPFEKEFRIRYRIDGVLYNQDSPPRELKAAIISRVKLMAKLNIAERRLPQDGRIKIKTLGREVDLRVSTLPTLYGESVVMRLLDRQRGRFLRSASGSASTTHMLSRMEYYTSLPHGIFLVTGPTGSGKSTTLYSALKRINHAGQEDHHDRRSGRISDGRDQPDPRESADRPDVRRGHCGTSCARIRTSSWSAKSAIARRRTSRSASALTGHFVFSTLHTNDAPSAITRLTDMGVENYLMSSSLVSVLAQRLVRVICKHCRVDGGHALYARRRDDRDLSRRGLRAVLRHAATPAASASSR